MIAPGGLWLVRHGATTAPVGVAIGLSDPPLSPEGKQQAKALAGRLSRRPLLGVYASDRIRAIETATSIAAPHQLAVQVDARLRELDFGRWEYRDLAALWKEEPDAAAAWERSLRATPASFGESLTQLEERVAAFFKDAREAARGEIAVVAHRGPLAVLRSLVTGESLESTFASGFPVGSAFWLTVDAGLVAEPADGVEDAREIRMAGGGDAHVAREPE